MNEQRRKDADEFLLRAMKTVEKDPHGQSSLLQAQVFATLAVGLLMQEVLDQSIFIDLEDEDEDMPHEGDAPPWG